MQGNCERCEEYREGTWMNVTSFVCQPCQDDEWEFWNNVCVEMLGYTIEELSNNA